MPTPADRPRKTKPKRPHLPAASGAIGSCNTRSTPSRSPCPHCSTAPRPTTPSTTTARARTSASPSPCSTSCPHFPIPACAGSARRGDLQRGQRRRHRGDSPRLCAVLPAVTILSGPFAASSRPGRGARAPAKKLWAATQIFCRPRPSRRRFAVATWPVRTQPPGNCTEHDANQGQHTFLARCGLLVVS